MTYQEQYDKLMKHAEQYPEFEATQRKLGMAISCPSTQNEARIGGHIWLKLR